ncbi:ANTAR domain-containing protein [Streptomyces sp. SRF1]|uniref:ANTAR domain-containing protein n=1 Tax=Streptomyces sp. SRF1 TaxID=1549642 RepID=UPI0025AEF299|nr:ANTAR domain-containing protein [Streptomyces sp. SRF1]MDN3055729.1 ANTAR domain-containing protein [Streptomyces sp. SRF1]
MSTVPGYVRAAGAARSSAVCRGKRRREPGASERGARLAAETVSPAEELAQLREAMASRPVIDQARGMVMAMVPCPAEAAWEVLVETSHHTNTKLRDIASRLVATTEGRRLPPEVEKAMAATFRRHRPDPGW